MHPATSALKRNEAGAAQPERRPIQGALGRYKPLSEIGEGGFAKVLLAEDAGGREVAVKLLREEYIHMRLQEAYFYNEVQALRSIDHPGVVKLVDTGREADRPFIAMEYIDGKPLHMADREFVQRSMLKVAALVCEALSAVHAAGIVHGDLLPGNIMLIEGTGGISVKIIDFGSSTVPFLAPCPGWDCMRVGGAAYASPENQKGRDMMDRRSDIYTLGAVMYDMLASVPFFALLGMNEARDPMRYDVPPETIEGVGPEVNALLAKALAKEPRDRFQDAREMRETLEECLAKAA